MLTFSDARRQFKTVNLCSLERLEVGARELEPSSGPTGSSLMIEKQHITSVKCVNLDFKILRLHFSGFCRTSSSLPFLNLIVISQREKRVHDLTALKASFGGLSRTHELKINRGIPVQLSL